MENRPGSWNNESTEDDDTAEASSTSRNTERRIPFVPLTEKTPPLAPAPERSFSFAVFMEQQRKAEEARRAAEEAAVSKKLLEADDDEEESEPTGKADDAELTEADGVASATYTESEPEPVVATLVEATTSATQEPEQPEVTAEAAESAAVGRAHNDTAETQQTVAEDELHIDPAALEQLQQEAEAYANALLNDDELAPAPSEPGDTEALRTADDEAALETAGLPEAAGEPVDAAAQETDAEADDDPAAAAGTTGRIPRQRTASPTAPLAPPPFATPTPRAAGGGIPVRPASGGSYTTASPAAGGGGPSGPVYGSGGGGGGFGPPSPGMGPSGPNMLGAPVGLGGNLLHSHEHWHPKTFFALAGAILVSDVLGRRRDRKITQEMRERTDKLKDIIEQNTLQTEQQQATLKRHAAEMQESYESSRRTLASRLEHVESHQTQMTQQANAAERQTQPAAPVADRTATFEPNLTRSNAKTSLPSVDRILRAPAAVSVRAEQAAGPMDRRIFEQQPAGSAVAPEIVPDTERFAELQARPDMVAEQVAQAAELGVSTEKVYERRQEVRDEAGFSGGQQGGGAAVTGSTVYDAYAYQPQAAASRQFAETQAQLAQGQSYQKPGKDMYRTAMQAGFWGGVVVIVLALIAVFAL